MNLNKIIFSIFLGISTVFISFLFGIGIIMGYITAKYFSGKKTYQKGKINSIVFSLHKWRIHLHHWLLSFIFLVFIFIAGEIYYLPNFFLGVFGGLTLQGIACYEDWYRIISRHRNTSMGR